MKRPVVITPEFLSGLSEYFFWDNACSWSTSGNSYLFTAPRDHVSAFQPDDVPAALRKMERLSKRFWLAGCMRYEAAAVFMPSNHLLTKIPCDRQKPLVWFGVYDEPVRVQDVRDSHVHAAPVSCHAQINYRNYQKALRAIKAHIHAGNTYQVNYTFDVLVRAGCSPEFLYFLLRRKQQTPYCAAIRNPHEQILSFSPELFFQRDGNMIWTKPMKGTSARGRTQEEDARSRVALRCDSKNRAENLMIVDLLRNDLGRICDPGTVHVPSMFDVETHPTVHQMTSLIRGRLPAGVTYESLFASLFPCGSVTGAPKIKTMQIIHQQEQGRRGVYCGAIGYIAPERKAVFSVPIRILQKETGQTDWTYRVGSGIVWDSSVQGEWQESRLKTGFLTAQALPDFDLVETMLWDGQKISFEQQHIHRLKCSAGALGFKLRAAVLKNVIARIKRKSAGCKEMIRLLVSKNGGVRFEKFLLNHTRNQNIVRVSDQCLDCDNILLRHKSTYRPWYDSSMAKIRRGRIWDEIFFNQHGEVCEGARSNVFIKKRGRLYTPPLSSGLLPGIFRQYMLETCQCQEKILYLKDVKSADALYCGNSVRGLVEVSLDG